MSTCAAPHITADSERFLAELRAYIGPDIGQFNYQDMVSGFRSMSQFYNMVECISHYRSPAGATVLSSGCGFAGSVFAWADAGAARVWGIEIDARIARIAGIRVEGWPAAGVLLYDGDRLPFPDGTFDIVDSVHVVEHVRDLRTYVDDLLRVLKPGGLCYIECPNRLYYRELHTQFRFVHWLPRWMAHGAARRLVRLPRLSPSLRGRLEALTTLTYRYPTAATLLRLLAPRVSAIHFWSPRATLRRALARWPWLQLVLPTQLIHMIVIK